MSIGEFFDGVVKDSITPRDASLIQGFRSLHDEAQREVEELIACKRQQARREDH